MASDLYGIAVRDTNAALRGVERDLSRAVENAEWLQIPLARVGDALRLGLELSRPLRAWLGGLAPEELKGALASMTEEAASWSLPTRPVGEDEDPILTTVLRRRDEAESLRAAVRRAAQPKGHVAQSWSEYVALSAALSTADDGIRRVVTRARVTELLGARAAMRPTWADAFDEEPDEEPSTDEGDLPLGVAATVRLADEDIARYVTRGALSRLVEGMAAANGQFAEELAECIDGLLEAREEVAWVARRWRKAAPIRCERDPLVLRSVPAVRLAAASAPVVSSEATLVHLWTLSPLDAEACVELTPREVVLVVFPGEDPLLRLELADRVCTAADEDGVWRVRLALPSGPVTVRVVGADGRVFASELGFANADPSDEAE